MQNKSNTPTLSEAIVGQHTESDPPEVPTIDPPSESAAKPAPTDLPGIANKVLQEEINHAAEKVRGSLGGYIPAFRRTILLDALAEVNAEMKLVDQLASMEPEVRDAVSKLDLRTRGIVALLASLNDAEGITNSVRYPNDILNDLSCDEDAIEKAHEQFPDDPIIATLYRANRLLERIDEGESEETIKDEGGDDTASEEGQQNTDERPKLSIDKVSGEFRMIVEWLKKRTIEEKIAAVAAGVLLDGDVQLHIERSGGYKGDVGDDLDSDWKTEVAEVLASEEARKSVSPETLAVASYIMGVYLSAQ